MQKIGSHVREVVSQAMLQQTAHSLHTKQTAKLCRLRSKEPIEIKVPYSSEADRLAEKGSLKERHAKTRIKPATIAITIKKWVTLGPSTGGKRREQRLIQQHH